MRAFPLLVWSERWRAGQRPVSMTATGGPLGARHNRSAPHVGKREAACFGAVGVEKVVQGSPGVEGFPQKPPERLTSSSTATQTSHEATQTKSSRV